MYIGTILGVLAPGSRIVSRIITPHLARPDSYQLLNVVKPLVLLRLSTVLLESILSLLMCSSKLFFCVSRSLSFAAVLLHPVSCLDNFRIDLIQCFLMLLHGAIYEITRCGRTDSGRDIRATEKSNHTCTGGAHSAHCDASFSSATGKPSSTQAGSCGHCGRAYESKRLANRTGCKHDTK